MMKFIFYTAMLIAIHFTMSVSAITCSGTDPHLENILRTGLRILDNVMVNKTIYCACSISVV